MFYLILVLLFPENCWAYLDPGTGSYFFQVVIAIFLGGVFTLKIYWKNTKDFISKLIFKNSKKDKLK